MDDIFAELDAIRHKSGYECSVCAWLNTLSAEDRANWVTAFEAPREKYASTSLHEVAKRHGAPFGYQSVQRHRRGHQ